MFSREGAADKELQQLSIQDRCPNDARRNVKDRRMSRQTDRSPSTQNYFEISETTDWTAGARVHLVLKESEYQGLVLCRLKAVAEDLEMMASDEEDSDNADPDPVEKIASEESVTNLEWNECFEKFYISKKDKWEHFASQLREFCIDVDNVVRVDNESRLSTSSTLNAQPPSTTTTTTTEQVQLTGAAGGAPKPKRKRVKEVCRSEKNFEKAVVNLLSYMDWYKMSAQEVHSTYGESIKSTFKYDDYELMIRVGDEELRRMSSLLFNSIQKHLFKHDIK